MAKLHKRGEILLVPFPFSDLSASKVRPAVVISSISYHKSQPDLLVAAITSNLVAATTGLDYKLQDWKVAGLRTASAFKPAIFTLEPTRIVHAVGTLSDRDLREIDKRLEAALDLSQRHTRIG